MKPPCKECIRCDFCNDMGKFGITKPLDDYFMCFVSNEEFEDDIWCYCIDCKYSKPLKDSYIYCSRHYSIQHKNSFCGYCKNK